jgi:hypothetical protein
MTTKFFIYDLTDNQNRPIIDSFLNNRSMDVIDDLDGWDTAEEAQAVIDINGWNDSCKVYEY